MFKRVIVTALLLVSFVQISSAGWSPVAIGLFYPLQLPVGAESCVYGLKINPIYMKHDSVYGLDVGFINDSVNSAGIIIGGFNVNSRKQYGMVLGIMNHANTGFYGFQAGCFNGSEYHNSLGASEVGSAGLQISIVNLLRTRFAGLQVGVANLSDNAFSGMQIGLFNSKSARATVADDYLNYMKDSSKPEAKKGDEGFCLQFGILNFNEDGFLPIMLLFNF